MSTIQNIITARETFSRNRHQWAQMSIAIGAILISFSAVFAKVTAVGPTASAFYRMGFAGLILSLVCLIRRERLWSTPKVFYYNSLAAIFMCIDLSFWHRSIQHLGPGLATILGNCQVFVLAFLGILFYQERVNYKFFIAIAMAVVGMYLLVADQWGIQGSGYKIGVVQGLATAIGYAGYVVYLKKVQQLPDTLSMKANLVQVCFCSSILLLGYTLFEHEVIAIPDMMNFIYLFLYALIGQVIGWTLISKGLPFTSISIAGFLLLFQPSLSFVWDMIFFHRHTPPIELIGATITLAAIYLSTVSKRKGRKKAAGNLGGQVKSRFNEFTS